MNDYIDAVKEWAHNNPTKATLISAVLIAFILGALLF